MTEQSEGGKVFLVIFGDTGQVGFAKVDGARF